MSTITERLAEALRKIVAEARAYELTGKKIVGWMEESESALAAYDAQRAQGEAVPDGRTLARDRDEWFASLSGSVLEGSPTGKYLRNRLELAFIGGWDARAKYAAPQQAQPAGTLTFDAFRAANVARCLKWHPQGIASWSPSDWLTAVTGELGELASLLKMRNRERDGLPGNKFSPTQKRIADELADVLTYLDLLAEALGVNLGHAVVEKFNEVSERLGFPDRIVLATHSPTADEKAQPAGEDAIERAAQAIYEHWGFGALPEYPWVPNGNSLKQDQARIYARAAIAALASQAQPAGARGVTDEDVERACRVWVGTGRWHMIGEHDRRDMRAALESFASAQEKKP